MFNDFAIVLSSGITGRYVLTGSVTAPNSCFESVGAIVPGLPPGTVGIDADLHFLFNLSFKQSPFCLQVLTGVSFIKELDERALDDHTRVVAHLMLNGAVLAERVLTYRLGSKTSAFVLTDKGETLPDYARALTPVAFETLAYDGHVPWPGVLHEQP